MKNQRISPLWIAGMTCIILLLNGCYTPPPIPKVRTPIPVQLRELFLETEDLPKLSPAIEWDRTEPYDLLDRWEWSNAIAAMDIWFTYGTSTRVLQTVVQYGDSAGAESIWREMREQGVVPELSGKPVNFLNEQELPPLHAGNIALRCENHYRNDSRVPYSVHCAARLQYGVLYVEIQSPVTGGRLSKSQFYALIGEVDEQMRPVWEATLLPNAVESPNTHD